MFYMTIPNISKAADSITMMYHSILNNLLYCIGVSDYKCLIDIQN